MSLGFRDQKEARRRRWRVIRFLITLAVLVALGVSAYRTGMFLAERESVRLRNEVERLTAEVAALSDGKAQAEEQAAVARQAEAEWRKRYETEVPTGKERELLDSIREQTGKGADPTRLAFLITTAAKERDCDAEGVTKRFLPRTAISVGASDAVTFAEGAIVVTGEGEPASNAEGKPEAWFDAGKPVTLRFIQAGGEASEAAGLLPLHHSVVRGNSEYQFNIVAGERQGFVTVTAIRCAFP
jgi:hypothetical protein